MTNDPERRAQLRAELDRIEAWELMDHLWREFGVPSHRELRLMIAEARAQRERADRAEQQLREIRNTNPKEKYE